MLAMMLSLASIFIVTSEGAPTQRHEKCCISKYGHQPPSEIRATKQLKEAYESYTQTMPITGQNCSKEPLLVNSTPSDFTNSFTFPTCACCLERLIVLKHKVALAVKVLMNMANSNLSTNVIKPLEDWQIIKNDLRICTSKHRTQHSRHLKHWLRNFNKIKKTETPECLQKAVIPRLFQLRQEVICVAQDKKCGEKRSRLASPSMN
uniref:Interferon lambda-3-like n=1 Tax=Geotrypetes seraphini TaxID=260995 RepID=A0A6P8RWN8_GEOSA|nr:interferon lambda-3-like [Geotrypetes seraphini]